jgi:pantetheine-phosphate adenylyltransferase
VTGIQQRLAIFPGSFDPLTNGHLDVIHRAASLFDRVVVAVLINSAKQPAFSNEERVQMIREATSGSTNIDVDTFDGLLADYVRARGAVAVVRGLRTAVEFSDEWQIALTNRHLNPDCETVFLLPSVAHLFVSSRLVREVASYGGPLDGLVPPGVARRLSEQNRRGGPR